MEFDKDSNLSVSARVVSVWTGRPKDDEAIISVRYNGRCFSIHVSPSFFHNSPAATALCPKYLQAIESFCDGEYEDEVDTDVRKWIIDLFTPIYVQLAPEPLPSFDPEKIRSGDAKPLLSEYLFPQTFGFRLEAVNEVYNPRHVDNDGGLLTPCAYLDGDLLDDMEDWTRFINPAEIEVYFQNPRDALDKMPRRVLVDLDGSGQMTTCFFKEPSGIGSKDCPMSIEIKAYAKMHKANFGPDVRVPRLHGVVHNDEPNDSTLGLLLSYIDQRATLHQAVKDDPPLAMRQKWAKQIEHTLKELHRAGVIWGDPKPDNIMIDKEDNVVLVDFEGGHFTMGWVDAEKVGTVEGDLQGLQNIMAFLFKPNTDEIDSRASKL
ncbi:hypothetical protein F4777DRAFT_563704 [Nemania sp. FL0916]|nr:hypothetical protein F4777DRAFT_563704 [Nemania sp. FL0916]